MSTIAVPSPVPSAEEDAHSIRKAVEGWGADRKGLLDVICRRTSTQRAEIRLAYERLYRESLVERLRSELAFNIHSQRVMIHLVRDPAERDAKLAHNALKDKGEKDILLLVEIACISSPDHLIAVRRAYISLFDSSLEEDVASSSLKEPLKSLLVRFLTSFRYSGEHVDLTVAKHEATLLSTAIKNVHPNDEDTIRIIGTRSIPQLKTTFQHYSQTYQKDITEDIHSSINAEFSDILKACVLCLSLPEKYFAEVIRGSIERIGTDEETLSRAVACRADIDMKRIKEQYKTMYNTSLSHDVGADTSGYYKDVLLALIGNEDA